MTGILNTTQAETKASETLKHWKKETVYNYDYSEIQMFTVTDVLNELNVLRDWFACLEGLFVL